MPCRKWKFNKKKNKIKKKEDQDRNQLSLGKEIHPVSLSLPRSCTSWLHELRSLPASQRLFPLCQMGILKAPTAQICWEDPVREMAHKSASDTDCLARDRGSILAIIFTVCDLPQLGLVERQGRESGNVQIGEFTQQRG